AAILFGILALTLSCQTNKPTTMADLIIINSKIWTANPAQPFAEAMAIAGDTILAVGTTREILKYKNAHTEVLDKPGELVLPGFIDSHLHFLTGGFSLSSVQLKDAATKEEFIKRIKKFAEKMNPDEWMLEGFWDHENWGGELPTRLWIDEFTKDIPVFVSRSDGHMALANTAALKAAGITRDTRNVDGGEIERDEKGDPTGIFKDNAMSLVSKHIPDYSELQYSNALDAAMTYVSKQGVTSVHHMGTLADFEVFKTKQDSGKLKTRIYATAPLWQYEKILKRKSQLDSSDTWLVLNGAKIFADGSLGSKTAAFTEPYLDAPDETGLLMDDPKHMLEGILMADKAGLQIVVHAIGDRANHFILDFYEEAIKQNGPRDRRSRIEHAQHLLPEDVSRFGELGVIASMQPWHLMDDGRWAERTIGYERAKTTYCFRSLLDKGATLAFGSDWFVAPPIPLEGIYAAVTRHTLDGGHPDGWIPEEKISLEEALIAYTLDAAYASFEENIKGSLEVGKLADFVILDQNLFSIAVEEIANVEVVSTFVGGKLVFRDAGRDTDFSSSTLKTEL
ncbi:MAG: amidohydrolase, partial [Bacteroidales bacterium]|nr:amidohydrolase [Bacteroidales bacterium]